MRVFCAVALPRPAGRPPPIMYSFPLTTVVQYSSSGFGTGANFSCVSHRPGICAAAISVAHTTSAATEKHVRLKLTDITGLLFAPIGCARGGELEDFIHTRMQLRPAAACEGGMSRDRMQPIAEGAEHDAVPRRRHGRQAVPLVCGRID